MQGVKLSAPQGSCSLAAGDGACAERLVGTWVLVTNSSLQDFEASEEFTSFMQAMNLLNDTGERCPAQQQLCSSAAHAS